MRFVVVDLEATCWSEADQPELYAIQEESSEIIEIGAVMLDDDLEPVREFQRFVRPVRHPVLSPFCTQLTSITQAEVDAADEFATAYAEFADWMGGTEGATFVSWGRYDHNQLVRETAAASLPMPGWTPVNAKDEFTAWVRGHTGRKLRCGLSRALTTINAPFTGTAHRGIDDARNLVTVFRHIRDVSNRSANASRALEVMHERHPRPANVGHLRARWPDAKSWFPRVSQELLRLRLAEDAGQGRGLRLTERGLLLV